MECYVVKKGDKFLYYNFNLAFTTWEPNLSNATMFSDITQVNHSLMRAAYTSETFKRDFAGAEVRKLVLGDVVSTYNDWF